MVCQAHPALQSVSKVIFCGPPGGGGHFSGDVRFSPPVNGPKDPWPIVLSLPGAQVVCWRPHPAGTRQYRLIHDSFLMHTILQFTLLVKNYKELKVEVK